MLSEPIKTGGVIRMPGDQIIATCALVVACDGDGKDVEGRRVQTMITVQPHAAWFKHRGLVKKDEQELVFLDALAGAVEAMTVNLNDRLDAMEDQDQARHIRRYFWRDMECILGRGAVDAVWGSSVQEDGQGGFVITVKDDDL